MINNEHHQQQSTKWGFKKSKRSTSVNPSTIPHFQPNAQALPPKSPPILTASPPAASSSRRSASGDFDPALREEWAALFDKTFIDFGSSDNSKLIFSNTQSYSRIGSDPVNNSPTQLSNKIPPPLEMGTEKPLPQSRINSELPSVTRLKEDVSAKRSSTDPPRRQDQQRQLLLQQQQMQEQRRGQIEQERRAQMEQEQQRRAIEHERQRQMQIQQEQERQRQIQLQQQEQERQRQLQIQQEQEKQRQLQMQQEQERQRQLQIQQEQERQIQLTMQQEQQRQRQMQQLQAEQQRQMMQQQQQDQRLRQQSAPVPGQAPLPGPFPTPVISAPSTPPTPPKQGLSPEDLPPRATGGPATFFNPSAGPQQFPPAEYAHRSSTSSPPRATTPELRRDTSWSPFGFGKSGQPTNGYPGNFPPVAVAPPRKSTESNSSIRVPFVKSTRSLTDIKQGPDFGQQPAPALPMPKSALVQRPPAPKGTTSSGVGYTTRLATGAAAPEVGVDAISSTRARANAALELMEMRNPDPHKSIAAQRRERKIQRKATPSVISTHSVDESVRARILATVVPNARISFVRGRDGMLQIVCPDSEVVRIGTGREAEPAPPTPPAMNAVAGVMGAAGYQGYFDSATGQIMVARINDTIIEEVEKEWDEASTTPIEEAPPGNGFVTDRQYSAVYDAMGQFVGFQIAEIGVGTEPVPRRAYNTASQTDPMEGFAEVAVGVDMADLEIQTDAVEVGETGVGVETMEVEVQSDAWETQEISTEGVQMCEIETQTDDVAVGEVSIGLDKEEAGLQTEGWETKEVGTEGVETHDVGAETSSEVRSEASSEVTAVDAETESRGVDVTSVVDNEKVVEVQVGSPETLVDSEQIEAETVEDKLEVVEEVGEGAVEAFQTIGVDETKEVSTGVEYTSRMLNETEVAAVVVEVSKEVAGEAASTTIQEAAVSENSQPTDSQQGLPTSEPSAKTITSTQRAEDDEVVVVAEEEVIEPRATSSRTLHRSKSVSSPRRRVAPSAVQPISIPTDDFKAQNRSSKSATTGAQMYRAASVKARKAEIEEAQDAELLEKLKRRPSVGALAAVGEGKVLPGVLNLEVENPTYPQVLEFWTEVAAKKPEPGTPVVTEAKEV
ncbi:hypothetical protein BJ742DRAFT_774684 [Cladochytrium replicatum]|nr:hypothetical protein BJ742DRAFT_774684 [Cladochytrium replicatum]